ncbi:MAG TPA: hypothetical protein VKE74_15985 [Gemmataceae bacterium]|nr:hypothetical protein [Gemmataceae bacterium]
MTVLRRRPGIASVATLGVITLTLGTARILAPEWSRHAGLDVWNYPGLTDDLRATDHDRKELEAKHERLRCQIEAADHVIELLIDGELTLPAAVDEIERITQNRSGFPGSLRVSHPDASTDRQLIVRYAIRKAAERLAEDPAQQARVLARLEAEYRQLPSGE